MRTTPATVMDLPRIFTIRESNHRIHNPPAADKFATLGASLRLPAGTRVLDLAGGSGEMLCTWARDLGFTGTGGDGPLGRRSLADKTVPAL